MQALVRRSVSSAFAHLAHRRVHSVDVIERPPPAILPEWEAASRARRLQSAAALLLGSCRALYEASKLAREVRLSRRGSPPAAACAGAAEKRSFANARRPALARDQCSAPAPPDGIPRRAFCSRPGGRRRARTCATFAEMPKGSYWIEPDRSRSPPSLPCR